MTCRAAALTWTETAARAARLLVVPLGATEQHGPHLPASTDTDVADALTMARLGRVRRPGPAEPARCSWSRGRRSAPDVDAELLAVDVPRSTSGLRLGVSVRALCEAPLPRLVQVMVQLDGATMSCYYCRRSGSRRERVKPDPAI